MIVSVCEFMRVPFGCEPGRSVLGIVGTHPGSFRKSGKQRGCRIRNLEEGTENRRPQRWKVEGLQVGMLKTKTGGAGRVEKTDSTHRT